MNTRELKQYIDRVLGNKIRCLLPSFWWKKLFHSVADRIDDVETNANNILLSSIDEAKKDLEIPIVESEEELENLDVSIGKLATVVCQGRSFRECYWPTEFPENVDDRLPLLTHIPNINVLEGPINSTIVMALQSSNNGGAAKIIQLVVDNDQQMVAAVDGVTNRAYILSRNGHVYAYVLQEFNDLLASDVYRYIARGGNDNLTEDEFDALDKLIRWDVSSNVYIRGGSWERIVKERDLEGIGGGTINADGVEIRELRINSNLSDEDKAYNIETVELYKEGKALVIVPVGYSQTSTERTDRMMAPFFVDLHTGDSTKLATFRFLNPRMDETDPFEKGVIRETTVVISNDGSVSGTERSFYDVAMSDTSTKAVQNKVIKKYIDDAIANVGGGEGGTTTSGIQALEVKYNWDGTPLSDEDKAVNAATYTKLIENTNSIPYVTYNDEIMGMAAKYRGTIMGLPTEDYPTCIVVFDIPLMNELVGILSYEKYFIELSSDGNAGGDMMPEGPIGMLGLQVGMTFEQIMEQITALGITPDIFTAFQDKVIIAEPDSSNGLYKMYGNLTYASINGTRIDFIAEHPTSGLKRYYVCISTEEGGDGVLKAFTIKNSTLYINPSENQVDINKDIFADTPLTIDLDLSTFKIRKVNTYYTPISYYRNTILQNHQFIMDYVQVTIYCDGAFETWQINSDGTTQKIS